MRNEEIPGDKNSSFQWFRKRFMISLAGSVITREKRSANDFQKIDCDDAIKKAANKYVDLTWKVKGDGDDLDIAYCNRNRNCQVIKNSLEDERILVLDIFNGTLSIKRSSPQKKNHSVSLLCVVEKDTGTQYTQEVKIYYSLMCKLRLFFKLSRSGPLELFVRYVTVAMKEMNVNNNNNNNNDNSDNKKNNSYSNVNNNNNNNNNNNKLITT